VKRFYYRSVVLIGLLTNHALAFAQSAYEQGFRRRAKLLLDATAQQYRPPSSQIGDAEKYYYPQAIARLSTLGPNDSLAQAHVALFRHKDPFHFTIIGLTRLLYLFPKEPTLRANLMGYCQRVTQRNDADNAFTGEGTENHVNMARTSGYLLMQLAQQTAPSTLYEQKIRVAAQWLRAYAQRYTEVGNAEWNSSTYDAYSVAAWLNVYDFAQDTTLINTAQAVLDGYARQIALHCSWGLTGGAEMRGAGIGAYAAATNYLAWLWFGEEFTVDFSTNREYIQSVHAATSQYRPPADCLPLALKNQTLPQVHRGYRPNYSLEDGHFVEEHFWTSPSFTLGSTANAYGGWTGTTTQLINWKLVNKPTPPNTKVLEISGNGRFYDDWIGKGRQPFTQVAQHQNLLFQLTCTPIHAEQIWGQISQITKQWQADWQRDFSLRFPEHNKKNIVNLNEKVLFRNESYLTLPPEAQVEATQQGYLVRLPSVWLRCTAVGRVYYDTLVGQRKVLLSQAPRSQVCGWVIEAHEASAFGHWDTFKQQMTLRQLAVCRYQIEYALPQQIIRATYQPKGSHQEALVDWGYGPTKALAVAFSTAQTPSPYQQPRWPRGKWHGRIATLSITLNPR
jgi:hypothetical protein